MRYEKADDISYVDLKEACRIFNRHKNMLGTRIKIRKQGFAYLMEAFIKAMMSIPDDQRMNIPEEVNAFYQALPAECFETLNMAGLERIEYSLDNIPKFGEAEDPSSMRDAGGHTPATHTGSKHKQGLLPLAEGKIKVRTNTGLMTVIRYLEDLVAALKKKNLYIVSGNRVIVMKPDTTIGIKLRAGKHKDKHYHREQLTIKFQWVKKIATDQSADSSYSISSNRHPGNGE